MLKTWPEGTRRRARVVNKVRSRTAGTVLVCVDECEEGHVLVGCWIGPEVQVGTEGELVFTLGGPMGGYWRFSASAGQAPPLNGETVTPQAAEESAGPAESGAGIEKERENTDRCQGR